MNFKFFSESRSQGFWIFNFRLGPKIPGIPGLLGQLWHSGFSRSSVSGFFYFGIFFPGIRDFLYLFYPRNYRDVSEIYAIVPGLVRNPRFSGSFLSSGKEQLRVNYMVLITITAYWLNFCSKWCWFELLQNSEKRNSIKAFSSDKTQFSRQRLIRSTWWIVFSALKHFSSQNLEKSITDKEVKIIESRKNRLKLSYKQIVWKQR